MRRAAQRDANEAPIVEALRARGASVTLLSAGGVPDLLVGYKAITLLLEVKLPLGPRGGAVGHQHLNERQREWWSTWNGQAQVVRSIEDAMAALDLVDQHIALAPSIVLDSVSELLEAPKPASKRARRRS